MTRLHYLILRNRKQVPLGLLTPAIQALFLKYRQLIFDMTSFARNHHWLQTDRCGLSSNLVYRVNVRHRPLGITEAEDPDIQPYGIIPRRVP